MYGYLLRRILEWLPVLLISSIIVFAISHAMPGDLADMLAGPDATASDVDMIRQQYGFDRSIPVQYLHWLRHVIQGDFGISYIYHRPNSEIIFSRLPHSLILAICAFLLALLLGVTLGLLAGLKPGKSVDNIVIFIASLILAVPNFWFGLLAISIISVFMGWLPPGGYVSWEESPIEFLQSLILPSITLALHPTAVLMRFTRNAVSEILNESFVRAAKAKGLSRQRIIFRHILRNSLLTIVTITGIILGRMLGGAVIIESVFAWPGIGRLLVQSIINRDYGMVQGILLIIVTFFMVVNLLVDLLYSLIDPRISLSREKNS